MICCLLILLAIRASAAEDVGVTAFDCNHTKLEVLTYDLTRVDQCVLEEARNETYETINVQVIQRRDTEALMITRCAVRTQLMMWHCGMHSHSAMANYDFAMRPKEITHHECSEVSRTLRYKTDGIILEDLKMNQTNHITRTLAGSVWGEGHCTGASISLGGYTYQNVVVRRAYDITLESRLGFVKLGSEEIIAFGSLSCNLADGSCYDNELGRVIWNTPERDCQKTMYDSLYAGRARRVISTQLGTHSTYVHVRNDSPRSFQLFTPLIHYEPVCGVDSWTTPYAGLYVIQYRDKAPFPINPIGVANLDLMKYVEAKVVGYSLGAALTTANIINRMQHTQCMNHREALLNRLHIIAANPSSANLLVGNKQGVYGRVAGEVVHILQCPPVNVQLRTTRACTLEIPVTYQGRPVYMDPRTRILSDTFTHKPCGILTPIMFRHGTSWVKMSPGFSPADPPQVLKPREHDRFPFHEMASYAQGGIYDPQDLQQLRDFMLFSIRRDAMQSNILSGIEGETAPRYDLTQVLHEDGWKQLAKDRLKQMWGSMQVIGNWVSGFVGIYFCYVVIKTVLSTVLKTLSVYKLEGFSWRLLLAACPGFSQLYLARRMKAQQTPSAPEEEEVPLQDVIPEGVRRQAPAPPPRSNPSGVYPDITDNVGAL